jgi:hypothetical protein
MERIDFFEFLGDSMDLLRSESPARFASLSRSLDGLTGRLETEDGARAIRFADGRFEHREHDVGEADIEVRFKRQLVLDLVDGRIGFEEAIDREMLHVRGRVEIVERYHEGLMIFLGGAIRAPAFSMLLERFRGGEIPAD